MLRDKRIFFRLAGIAIAIFGAVIVIHMVPVQFRYLTLAVLIIIFTYLMLYR